MIYVITSRKTHMSIEKIILKGFKYFHKSKINYFEITPTTPIQLLLGSNGSGKSSLMNHLTQYPMGRKEFYEDGYIEKHTRHNKSYYVTKVTASPYRCSFIKDGVELNTSGNVTAQIELVKTEFGETKDTWALQTNKVAFSKMSSLEIRQWLIKVSGMDFTYPLKVYSRLKEQHRDTVGALKLHRQRLLDEQNTIMPEADVIIYEEDIEQLHQCLTKMAEIRKPLDAPLVSLEKSLKNQQEVIQADIAKVITALKAIKRKYVYSSPEALDQDITTTGNQIEINLGLMAQYATEVEQLRKDILARGAIGKQSKGQTDEAIINLNESLEAIDNAFVLGHELTVGAYQTLPDVHNALNALESIYDSLTNYLGDLVPNSDLKYSRAALNTLVGLLEETDIELNKITTLTETQLDIRKHFAHLKAHDQTTCPQCDHSWIKGYDEKQDQLAKLEIDQLNKRHDELNKIQETRREHHAEMLAYFQTYKEVTRIMEISPSLKPLWGYLDERGFLLSSPNQMITTIMSFKLDLLQLDKRIKVKNEIDQLMANKRALEETTKESLLSLLEREGALDNTLSNLTKEVTTYKENLKNLKQFKTETTLIQNALSKLEAQHATFETDRGILIENHRRHHLNEAIKETQLVLAHKQKELHKAQTQKGVMDDIKKQIKTLEEKEIKYKLLIKELSPTEGLIAEQLNTFISNYLSHVNEFIGAIWKTPLEILPPLFDIENGQELEYVFPFKIDGHVVDDISFASTGMKEVIDLAFKVTTLRCLGLTDAPLLLDEFGRSLDAAHRVTIIDTIKALVDEYSFSQLFMANHYDDIYSVLPLAEVCVLCPENIVLPPDVRYNEHVTIQ